MTDYSLPNQFDPIIHQPSRLSIMAILAGCKSADFVYIHRVTGLTKGPLSKHLNKLENEGYIVIKKSFKGSYPNTAVSLTADGRKAFKKYRHQYKLFTRLIDSHEV